MERCGRRCFPRMRSGFFLFLLWWDENVHNSGCVITSTGHRWASSNDLKETNTNPDEPFLLCLLTGIWKHAVLPLHASFWLHFICILLFSSPGRRHALLPWFQLKQDLLRGRGVVAVRRSSNSLSLKSGPSWVNPCDCDPKKSDSF